MIPRLTLALRLLLGAVFVYAAYTKLRQSWLLFALSIDSYQLLPEWGVYAVARTLPALELALGVLLAAGVWVRYLSIVAAAILALFFSVMVVSYFRGAGIDCGCFGVGEPLSAKTLFRDGVLLAAAIALVAYTRRSPKPSALSPQPSALVQSRSGLSGCSSSTAGGLSCVKWSCFGGVPGFQSCHGRSE